MDVNQGHEAHKLRELVERIRFCMLVTLDREGELRSRPLELLELDAQGNFWFFTAVGSPKVG
jgi:general stress protein 26